MYILLFVLRIWSLCVVIYRFCYVTYPFYFMSAQASLMESFFKLTERCLSYWKVEISS